MDIVCRNLKLTVVGALFAAGSWTAAFDAGAELLAYEGFEYERRQWFTTTPEWIQVPGIGGLNGGTGFAAAWDDQGRSQLFEGESFPIRGGIADVNNPNDFTAEVAGARSAPLGYTDTSGRSLVTAGNQYRGAFGNNNREFRSLDLDAPLGESGTSVWFSFLAQSDGTNRSYSRVGLTNSADPNDGIFFGKVNGGGTWAVQSPTTRSNLTADESVMYLVRIDFNEFAQAESDVVSVWLNPESLEEAPAGPPTLLIDTFDGDLSIDSLQIHSRYSTDYDEFRIGTTFASVTPFVPEPSTMGLLAAGVLGLVSRRRRCAH